MSVTCRAGTIYWYLSEDLSTPPCLNRDHIAQSLVFREVSFGFRLPICNLQFFLQSQNDSSGVTFCGSSVWKMIIINL